MSNDGDGTGVAGRLVAGRYRLAERIGSGGAGTVWRARDEPTWRQVAVKEPRLPGDPEDEVHRRAAHRLYREARAAARVDHPSAVTIHDVVVEDGAGPDGLPYIVMELVDGRSLREVLRGGPVGAVEAARIGLAVLGALRAAHAVGIVHRDVKPANVLLAPDGRVVVTDFGLAHVQGHGHGEEAGTGSGGCADSLEYVAPERMTDRTAGPASDLWSLGVLLYAAVEGVSPFHRPSPRATRAAILACEPPEPESAGPLGPLLTRLLVREPERRPDAEEVGRVLEAVAGRPGDGGRAQGRTAPRVPPGAAGAPVARAQVPPGAEEPQADRSAEPAGVCRADGHAPVPTPDDDPAPRRGPGPRRPFRTVPHVFLAALLLLAGLSGATLVGGPGSGTVARQTPAGSADRPAWTAHRAAGMDATLLLPSPYRAAGTDGGGAGRPRVARYDDRRGGAVRVRLSLWDRAPRTPLEQAREAHRGREGRDVGARTRFSRTSVGGHAAVVADTAYGPAARPRRVLRAVVRTGDGRLYELRVDMPRGGAQEKEGAAVFTGARERLRFEGE